MPKSTGTVMPLRPLGKVDLAVAALILKDSELMDTHQFNLSPTMKKTQPIDWGRGKTLYPVPLLLGSSPAQPGTVLQIS